MGRKSEIPSREAQTKLKRDLFQLSFSSSASVQWIYETSPLYPGRSLPFFPRTFRSLSCATANLVRALHSSKGNRRLSRWLLLISLKSPQIPARLALIISINVSIIILVRLRTSLSYKALLQLEVTPFEPYSYFLFWLSYSQLTSTKGRKTSSSSTALHGPNSLRQTDASVISPANIPLWRTERRGRILGIK